jgi:hypothetical protein
MKHPPYHLRPNKAVDRLMLIEVIRKYIKPNQMTEYTYYGFGGPYLEEFRLLHEHFPDVRMVSLEEDEETYKRQKFHKPCKHVQLYHQDFRAFLADYEAGNEAGIFWLDHVRLKYDDFEDFKVLLVKVATGSIVKISLRAEAKDYMDKGAAFRRQFGAIMPRPSEDPPQSFEKYSFLLQEMLQVAAQQALAGVEDRVFQPLTSHFYADGVGMFTLTGAVCSTSDVEEVKSRFDGWAFKNLAWEPPKRVDVPFLSSRERLHLQEHLPCDANPGETLLGVLGYLIDDERERTVDKLKQYADFYRHYPHFVRAVP